MLSFVRSSVGSAFQLSTLKLFIKFMGGCKIMYVKTFLVINIDYISMWNNMSRTRRQLFFLFLFIFFTIS